MKMLCKRNILIIYISIFLACFLLAGCHGKNGEGIGKPISGKSNSNESSQENTSQVTIAKAELPTYEATFFTLQGETWDLQHPKYGQGYVYFKSYEQEAKVWGITRVDSKNGLSEEWLVPTYPEEGRETRRGICCFDVMADGEILAVTAEYVFDEEYETKTVQGLFLTQYDVEGEELWSKDLPTDLIGNANFIEATFDMGVDGSGNALVSDGSHLLMLSSKGERLTELPMAEGTFLGSMACSKAGILYANFSNLQGEYLFQRVNFEKKTFENMEGNDERILGVASVWMDDQGTDSDADLIVYTAEKAFYYDEQKKEMTAMLGWSDSGVNGNKLRSLCLYGERLYGIADGELAVLIPQGSVLERKVLTLATIKNYGTAELAAAYNRSQKKYLVKVVEYGADAMSSVEFQDPANRMMIDVLGNDPPDLIDLTFFVGQGLEPSLPALVEQGYVEDLGPYLDRSGMLGREQFFEKALEMYSYQGTIAALPTAFSIRTLIASKEELGDRFGWATDELIAYDRAHPEMNLMYNCSCSAAYNVCVMQNLSEFVDFDQKETSFDGAEFRKLLEYAASYPTGSGIILVSVPDQLVRIASLESLSSLQKIQQIYFDGKAQFIGFPTLDGSPAFRLDIAGDSYAFSICARSQNKEEAWDFIEFVQKYEAINCEKYLQEFNGIPARKELLELCLKVLKKDKGYYPVGQANGVNYKYHPMTDEEVELFYKILDAARVEDPRMGAIRSMVYEEVQGYFAGQKSLDQTIDVIDQRVRLFLLEN